MSARFQQQNDQIWVDSEHKLRGICADIRTSVDEGRDVLVLAHFEDWVRKIAAALRAASIAYHPYSGFDEPILFASNQLTPPIVWLGLARDFHPRASIARTRSPARALTIIVAEHYPLPARDQSIIEAAQNLPRDTSLCFHAALTDALLVHFGSVQLQTLMKTLGADTETSLSHNLIDTAIRTAQEKIAKQVFTEMPTSSAEDWFRYNLRER